MKHLQNGNDAFGDMLKTKPVPVCSIDSDTFYTADVLSLWRGKNACFSFRDTTPKPIFSYVQVQDTGPPASIRTEDEDPKWRIVDIVEKEKISDYANAGVYCFASHLELMMYCQKIIEKVFNWLLT